MIDGPASDDGRGNVGVSVIDGPASNDGRGNVGVSVIDGPASDDGRGNVGVSVSWRIRLASQTKRRQRFRLCLRWECIDTLYVSNAPLY